MNKKILAVLIFLAALSFLFLQASNMEMDIKLRVFEGLRDGMAGPPQFVTSSYLRPTVTASIQSEFELDKEKEHIQRVFNLKSVNLLTEADLKFSPKASDSVSHFFRLNSKEYKVYIRLLDWKQKGQFLIVVNEHFDDRTENVLTTEITLLGGNIAVFGFEDRQGSPYFLSFHITGPEDKILTPPLPPPPKEKKELQDFEKGAVKAMGEIRPPRIIKKVDPVYPEEARKSGIEGVVLLSVRTDEHGRVERIKILKSFHPLLAEAAIEAVRQWEYEPFIKDGKPRKVVFTVTVRFKLKGKDEEKVGGVLGEKESEEVEPPRLIKKVDPMYPEEARKSGVEGTVLLSVGIDKKGNVKHLKVITSPDSLLSRAAVEAVRQWRYEPYFSKGRACEAEFTVAVTFKLDEKKKESGRYS